MADGDAEFSSSSQNHQTSSSASSVSSTEFHENLLTSLKDHNHSHGMSSVPPDFIPLKRSSWRSSSVAECSFAEKYGDDGRSKDDPGSDESSPSAKCSATKDGHDLRVSRAETGSMKESKTFAFGLRHLTESENKGKEQPRRI
ncbi:unnamed protein product [Orchesella dallaii]|uniref:Uncharacterized protein n=1 Tax=Orchesella dallaii TaxID=48710 RepID=A0ABP1QFQ7_9HEXA